MPADRLAGGFGGTLRAARERRGMSVRQIANATKISVAALDALERNDTSRLPGGIFSRAFVRSYAMEVGLDPETTIQEFIAQFPNDSVTAGHPHSDRVEDHEAVKSDQKTAGTFLWLAMISVPIAAGLLYLTASGRGAPRAAVKPSAPPAPPSTQGAPVAANPAEKGQLERAPADPPSSAPPPATPAEGATPQTAAGAPAPAAPPATSPGAPADRLTIVLSVKRPVWVSATVDGQKAIDRLLQPGERQTVDVRREMVLTAGDASAIAMTLNGAEARPLGKTGEVVTARFNLTNFKNYLQPQNR